MSDNENKENPFFGNREENDIKKFLRKCAENILKDDDEFENKEEN